MTWFHYKLKFPHSEDGACWFIQKLVSYFELEPESSWIKITPERNSDGRKFISPNIRPRPVYRMSLWTVSKDSKGNLRAFGYTFVACPHKFSGMEVPLSQLWNLKINFTFNIKQNTDIKHYRKLWYLHSGKILFACFECSILPNFQLDFTALELQSNSQKLYHVCEYKLNNFGLVDRHRGLASIAMPMFTNYIIQWTLRMNRWFSQRINVVLSLIFQFNSTLNSMYIERAELPINSAIMSFIVSRRVGDNVFQTYNDRRQYFSVTFCVEMLWFWA